MERKDGPYLNVTIHQLKSNIARYIRALERGEHKAILIHRYDRKVAVLWGYERLTSRDGAENTGSSGSAQAQHTEFE
ncbi:MAG: hypothetical protein H6860_01955 [Rhodospirillales bacterium]|nr:hypothetical protein [Alphaproteobacteria bacterium]MCB9981145.1 hypothetical protein [Rhodospirillales bacterium]